VPLQHMAQLFDERQPPGILHVAAVDHVDERADALAAPRSPATPIVSPRVDRGDLLALAQIGNGGRAVSFSATRNATPRQAPPRSSPSTRPGFSGVPRWTKE
jgi:hypothetical protein